MWDKTTIGAFNSVTQKDLGVSWLFELIIEIFFYKKRKWNISFKKFQFDRLIYIYFSSYVSIYLLIIIYMLASMVWFSEPASYLPFNLGFLLNLKNIPRLLCECAQRWLRYLQHCAKCKLFIGRMRFVKWYSTTCLPMYFIDTCYSQLIAPTTLNP